jgi:fused signal recognition particle receptor
MFEALKKKFSGWFGKKEEIDEKKEKKEIKQVKKETKKPEKKEKLQKTSKQTAKKTIKEEVHEEIEIIEDEIEQEKENKEEEIKKSTTSEAPVGQQISKKEPIKQKEIKEPEEKQGFFSKLFKKISSTGTVTLEQKHVEEIFAEIEITLLENNVALEVVDKIKENLHKDLVGIEVKKDKIEQTILESLKNSILSVLIEPPNLIENIKKSTSPYVILFFGINGSGKTTSIAKLASFLQKNKISCVLAAGDTFRAASIEQLQKHGEKLGVKVISSQYGSDPASVAFDAIKYAEKNKIQAVLIDTAGRMYTKANLLKEMEKIIRISKPNLKIFVGESITGNDMVTQCQTFNETVGIDGIVLTKSDIDEKGGAILSVSYITKKPIYCLGVGQNYEDLETFNSKKVLEKIGLG